jgi:glutamate dehydrogenase
VDILRRAFDADAIEFRTCITESVLARLHFVVHVAPDRPLPSPDHARRSKPSSAAAARSLEATRSPKSLSMPWGRGGCHRLTARVLRRCRRPWLGEAFPVARGVADIRHLDRLPTGATELNLYRPYDAGRRNRRLKDLPVGESGKSPVPILPVLQHLGVDVTDERPFTVPDAEGALYRIYDLGLVFVPEGEAAF